MEGDLALEPLHLEVPPFVPERIHVIVSQEKMGYSDVPWVVKITCSSSFHSGCRITDRKPPRIFKRWMLRKPQHHPVYKCNVWSRSGDGDTAAATEAGAASKYSP